MIPTPALDVWRRRGDLTTLDDLWRAAAWETAALELHSQGSLHRAEVAETIARGFAAQSGLAEPAEPRASVENVAMASRMGPVRPWKVRRP